MTLKLLAVNTQDAAIMLGMTEAALRNRNVRGTGPKSFSYGERDVHYLVSELETWVMKKAGVLHDNDNKPEKRGRRRKTANS